MALAAVLTILCALGSLLPSERFLATPAQYLGWHSGMEMVSIVIAAMVVALGWNLRSSSIGALSAVFGAGYLGVAVLDFVHTQSFAGMPDFVTPSGTEKAINFWLMGRLLAALTFITVALRSSLLAAPGTLSLRNAGLLYAGALAVSLGGAVLGLYAAERLPRTFIDGSGLTDFKVGSEYLIVVLHALAAWWLWQRSRQHGRDDLAWLAAASWVLGLAELFFTLYATVTDIYNLLGHIYKVLGSAMIYRALFVSGVQYPLTALRLEQTHVAELEQRWNMAIEGSRLGVWDWHIASGALWYSKGWKRIFGYDDDEAGASFDDWSSRVHPDDRAISRAEMELHFRGETPYYENRHRIRTKDGRYRWLLARGGVSSRDAAGQPVRVVGTHTDITEQVDAEAALATSLEQQRAVLETMTEGVVVHSLDGHVTYANPAAERILGIAPGEFIQRSTNDTNWVTVHSDGSEFPMAEYPSVLTLATGEAQRDVIMGVVHGRHGELVWLSINSETLRQSGITTGVLVTFSDVTAQRTMETQLRQQERHYHGIFEGLPMGVAVLTTGGDLVQANPALCALLGMSDARKGGLRLSDLFVAQGPAAALDDAVAKLGLELLPRHEVVGQVRALHGALPAARLVLRPLLNRDGRVASILAVFEMLAVPERDLTGKRI